MVGGGRQIALSLSYIDPVSKSKHTKQTEPRNRKNAHGWKTRQDNLKFEDKIRTERLETEEGAWPVRTLQDQNCNKEQRGSFPTKAISMT